MLFIKLLLHLDEPCRLAYGFRFLSSACGFKMKKDRIIAFNIPVSLLDQRKAKIHVVIFNGKIFIKVSRFFEGRLPYHQTSTCHRTHIAGKRSCTVVIDPCIRESDKLVCRSDSEIRYARMLDLHIIRIPELRTYSAALLLHCGTCHYLHPVLFYDLYVIV